MSIEPSLAMRPDELTWNERGLVPAIVQDAHTGQVLMHAYMNRESLAKSLETGETWFWSRSRQMLWHKGMTSGHVQRIVEIVADCDADVILVRVEPAGPACHTGRTSCFHRPLARRLEEGALGLVSDEVDLQ